MLYTGSMVFAASMFGASDAHTYANAMPDCCTSQYTSQYLRKDPRRPTTEKTMACPTRVTRSPMAPSSMALCATYAATG